MVNSIYYLLVYMNFNLFQFYFFIILLKTFLTKNFKRELELKNCISFALYFE